MNDAILFFIEQRQEFMPVQISGVVTPSPDIPERVGVPACTRADRERPPDGISFFHRCKETGREDPEGITCGRPGLQLSYIVPGSRPKWVEKFSFHGEKDVVTCVISELLLYL